MRKKRFLAAILLGAVLCFVVGGVGHGEIDERELQVKASYIQVSLLRAQVSYIMRNPTKFLNVGFFYYPPGQLPDKFPAYINTKGKIYISIIDNRDMFAGLSSIALLNAFKKVVEIIYSFIQLTATDMDVDIVADLHTEEGIPLAYFHQGEYLLWNESKETMRTEEPPKETESAPISLGPRGQIYTGATKGHWVSEKIDGGRIIELEDGSLWEISPLDRIDTMLWLVVQNISVIKRDDLLYPYYLLNKSTGDMVEAKLISS